MRVLSKAMVSVMLLAGHAAWGQMMPHVVGPPVAPGESVQEAQVDAFMSANGYQYQPSLQYFGHTDGNSAGQDSISLQPGNWAIGIVSISSPPCPLKVSYRDAGYTTGQQVYQAQQGNGFPYIALQVQSNLSGIAITVQDAAFNPALYNGRVCGYEYRFYAK